MESKEPEYPYDEYDYPPPSAGLPPGQMALLIGVNAVVSLIISITVVLIAMRQPATDGATAAALPPDNDSGVVEVNESVLPTATPAPAEPDPDLLQQGTPPANVVYAVREGDTLSSIATQFGVSMADIMLANGLTNENFIQVGQELIIPLGGLPTATVTFTPQPFPTDTPLPFDPPTPLPTDADLPPEPAATLGPTPIPTETPTPIPTSTPAPFDEINVVVSEVNGPGDLNRETVVVLNQGAGTSLRDWSLEGSELGVFVFPDIFLFSGGSIRVHTAAGQNTASDLYLNQGEAAWPPGETIILKDANGEQISTLTVP